MKYFLPFLFLFSLPAMADDPGKVSVCYHMLSDGWDIARFKARVPVAQQELALFHLVKSTWQLRPDRIAKMAPLIYFVWRTDGDAFDALLARARHCIYNIKYEGGNPSDWY